MQEMRMEYTKKWLPLDEQVERLVKRGLEVEDPGLMLKMCVWAWRVRGVFLPILVGV